MVPPRAVPVDARAQPIGPMDQNPPHWTEHQHARFDHGLELECGVTLKPLTMAYRTYGRLSDVADNAVLVCHALTGDQYVAEPHPVTGKPGWWDRLVGPGLPIDTDRYFVLCVNVLGGCMGSTGPRSARSAEGEPREDEPKDGEPWGTDFPPVTIRDMVRAQALVVSRLGIDRLFAVVGGSMGGMQVLSWAATFPERVFAALPIATASFHSAQNIAFNEVSRQAIFADPDWHGGRYWQEGLVPARGLAVARMMAHITYLSEEALTRKFGRRVRTDPAAPGMAAAGAKYSMRMAPVPASAIDAMNQPDSASSPTLLSTTRTLSAIPAATQRAQERQSESRRTKFLIRLLRRRRPERRRPRRPERRRPRRP